MNTKIIYNTQASRVNIKIFASRRIPFRFATAYVNQYLVLPNAMYSQSVYM
jgi:hypothetical protein